MWPRHDREFLKSEVESVLEEIGAGDIPQLLVYNKIDLLEREPRMTRDSDGTPRHGLRLGQIRCWTGVCLEWRLASVLRVIFFNACIELTPSQGKLRAALYELGAVKSEEWLEAGGSALNVHLPEADWTRLKTRYSF